MSKEVKRSIELKKDEDQAMDVDVSEVELTGLELKKYPLTDVALNEGSLSWSISNNYRRVYCYTGDEDARTTDPVKMQQNIRLPIYYAIQQGANISISPFYDPKDEFVISPALIVSKMGMKGYRKIEAFKRTLLPTLSTQMPIVPRSTTLNTIQQRSLGIRRVLKGKYGVRGLGKYWTRFQRMKQLREQKTKIKPVVHKRAVKKPLINGNTIVARDEKNYNSVVLSSLRTLGKDQQVNDEIIDYGVSLALKRHRDASDVYSTNVRGWTSFFAKKKKDLAKAKPASPIGFFRSTFMKRNPNPLALKFLVVPIVIDNHWLMIIICQPFPDEATVLKMEEIAGGPENMRDYSKALYQKWLQGRNRPKMLVFDSVADRNSRVSAGFLQSFHKNSVLNVKTALFDLHKHVWKNTGRDIKLSESIEDYFMEMLPYYVMKNPGQKGKDDCGLYLITYVAFWFTELKKVMDDYGTIYLKNFYQDFPHQECNNLRHTIYQIIEDGCSQNVDLLKEVVKFKVSPNYAGKKMDWKNGAFQIV